MKKSEETIIPVNGYVLISIESEFDEEVIEGGIILPKPAVGEGDPRPILTILAIDEKVKNPAMKIGDKIMAFTHFGVNKFNYRGKECGLIKYEEIVAYYANSEGIS